MKRIQTYVKDIYVELSEKVAWPTWEELQGSMVVVVTATLILTLMVWIMNEVSKLSMSGFYQLFR